MIKSGLPIEDFKAACYGDAEGKGAGPTLRVSAVGSAESKLKMKTVGGFHLTCIFAMYGLPPLTKVHTRGSASSA